MRKKWHSILREGGGEEGGGGKGGRGGGGRGRKGGKGEGGGGVNSLQDYSLVRQARLVGNVVSAFCSEYKCGNFTATTCNRNTFKTVIIPDNVIYTCNIAISEQLT